MEKRIRMRCRRLALLFAMLPLLADAAPSSTVTVKVTVVAPPPCTINDNRPIEVDFGNVTTTRVDGNNYLMPVNYTINCSGSVESGMKIQVSGTPAGFGDSSVLRTTITGLGIALKTDFGGSGRMLPFDINQWWHGYNPNQPWAFWAVPVKQSGTALRGGEFTASATMRVAYP